MSGNWNRDGDEGGEEEDEFKTPNDRIIFLVDCRVPMFKKNSKNEFHIVNCLSLALAVLKTKIISGENCSVGVTFFGVKETAADAAAAEGGEGAGAGVRTLLPLGPPSAAAIRSLQQIVESTETLLATVRPQSKERSLCPLKQALWTCSQLFSSKDSKANDLKRIWIFTNDDEPNAGLSSEQAATVTVARDCAQAGIEISLWHLNQTDAHRFDPSKFYTRILVAAGGEEDGLSDRMSGGGSEGFSDLIAAVRRRQFKKRRLQALRFSLATDSITGEDVSISMEVYKLVHVAGRPLHTWLYSRTNEPVKVLSRYFDSNTGAVLDVNSNEVSTYIDVGGSRVAMSKTDVTAIKALFSSASASSSSSSSSSSAAAATATATADDFVGLKLLGFVPRRILAADLNLDEPYFLFPNDKAIAGSSQVFECLLRDMTAKGLVAAVRFARLASSPAKIAVLVPQEEVLDEDGAQAVPPGFHLIILPYAEDIRSCPLPPVAPSLLESEDMEALIQKASNLISSFPVDSAVVYHKDIESPALQQFYSVLEAVALNDHTQRWSLEKDDKMRPGQEQLLGAADAVEDLKAALHLDLDPAAAPTKGKASKRSSEAAIEEKPSKKKAKGDAEPGAEGLSREEVLQLIQSGTLTKLTIPQLKEICRGVKVSTTGVKAVLVNTIIQAFAP